MKREPRVRWTARTGRGDRLLASPLGIVITTGRETPCAVLGPSSGVLRWTPSCVTRDAWLDRTWLLAHFSGEELHAWRVWNEPGEEDPSVGHERLPSGLVQLRVDPPEGDDAGRTTNVLRDVHPLRLPGGLGSRGRDVRGGAGRVVTGPGDWNAFILPRGARTPSDLLVASARDAQEGPWTTTLFDLDRGQVGWHAPGLLLAGDERGVVVSVPEGPGSRLVLRDARGGEVWTSVGALCALGPEVALVLVSDLQALGLQEFDDDARSSTLRVHDRATGRVRADLGPYAWARARDGTGASPILVRDRVYVPDRGDVVCRGLDGQVDWSIDVAEAAGSPRARILDLAPLPGALVVLMNDGQVVCLEDPGGRP